RGRRIEWWGTARLTFRRFRGLTAFGVVLTTAGFAVTVLGPLAVALPLVGGAELVGRYLFYVTVVPLDMPGSFLRSTR
ncbi:MAG TPA: hypothetical protein VFS16_01645, partial [Acidimicrobiia bacterium]|nr:hypothetical protein [Acidimicrobiia bacterium]